MDLIQFEDLQERILEMLLQDTTFDRAVTREVQMRFPNGVPPEMKDEITCICQLLVGQRVLKGILS